MWGALAAASPQNQARRRMRPLLKPAMWPRIAAPPGMPTTLQHCHPQRVSAMKIASHTSFAPWQIACTRVQRSRHLPSWDLSGHRRSAQLQAARGRALRRKLSALTSARRTAATSHAVSQGPHVMRSVLLCKTLSILFYFAFTIGCSQWPFIAA